MNSHTTGLPGLGALWFGMLGPPAIWAVRFVVAYLLVPFTCWWGWLWPLHLVSVVAFLGVVVAGGMALRAWRKVRGLDAGVDAVGRVRFMAAFGMASSALFAAVIIAEAIANLLVDPCFTATVPIANLLVDPCLSPTARGAA